MWPSHFDAAVAFAFPGKTKAARHSAFPPYRLRAVLIHLVITGLNACDGR